VPTYQERNKCFCPKLLGRSGILMDPFVARQILTQFVILIPTMFHF
jgi:hypothetical protein